MASWREVSNATVGSHRSAPIVAATHELAGFPRAASAQAVLAALSVASDNRATDVVRQTTSVTFRSTAPEPAETVQLIWSRAVEHLVCQAQLTAGVENVVPSQSNARHCGGRQHELPPIRFAMTRILEETNTAIVERLAADIVHVGQAMFGVAYSNATVRFEEKPQS